MDGRGLRSAVGLVGSAVSPAGPFFSLLSGGFSGTVGMQGHETVPTVSDITGRRVLFIGFWSL